MTIKTFFSKAKKGVENQVIFAMIVYLLTLLIKLELNVKQTIFQILRNIRSLKYEPYGLFKEIHEPD